MAREKKYRYSEIFKSIQGEGEYTGIPTVWLRLWGCNLSCHGFGQKDLDDPDTWIIPSDHIDFDKIKVLEDLPVFHTTCDSGYSHEKQYRHLATLSTVPDIVDELHKVLYSPHNTTASFIHEFSKKDTHMAFTGGEPMMSQAAIVAVLQAFIDRENAPRFVTIETNGTQELKPDFVEFIKGYTVPEGYGGTLPDDLGRHELFWSVSPKLRSSGEKWDDAIKPEIVESYSDISDRGQLKFVVDGSDRTWYEVDKAIEVFRKHEINWDVWIMPVGADVEMQEETAAIVANGAIDRGFNVAARVHTHIFGNLIGT